MLRVGPGWATLRADRLEPSNCEPCEVVAMPVTRWTGFCNGQQKYSVPYKYRIQDTVQHRTQRNGRDRSWLRDQGLGMTRDVPPRSTVHNTYCEELTWCCCGVSCCDADAVANNGAAAVLLSRPQPIDSYWPSQHFRVGCACMLRGKSGRVRRMPNRVGRNQARVNRTDGADSTNSRWNRGGKPRVS